MARFCSACGRPLDPQHHDEGPKRLVVRERGWAPPKYERSWGCRVRLIGQELTYNLETKEWEPDKVFVPETAQRAKKNNVRFVHESRFGPGKEFAA